MLGFSIIAAMSDMIATNDSIAMEPYHTMRTSRCFSIILGVVPDEMSAWKPEIAPHAIVMNAKGKTLPPKMGPVPSVKRVSAGISVGGCVAMIPIASAMIVPILMKAER